MARTVLNPQPVTSAGGAVTYTPAGADGHSIRLARGRLLHVKNGSGSSVTVTIPTPGTVDGLPIGDRTVAVPAGADRFIGLGRTAAYRQPGGVAHIDLSSTTSVTVAALDVP